MKGLGNEEIPYPFRGGRNSYPSERAWLFYPTGMYVRMYGEEQRC